MHPGVLSAGVGRVLAHAAYHVDIRWHADQHLALKQSDKRSYRAQLSFADWAYVMGVISKGPAGIPGILEKNLSATNLPDLRPQLCEPRPRQPVGSPQFRADKEAAAAARRALCCARK